VTSSAVEELAQQQERAFTVKELAQRIMLPDQDLSAVIERLRNWTKEGLLKPIGPKAIGSGRRRHYPWRAVFDAAVLNNLTCYFGVRATVLAPALDLAWKEVPKYYDYFAGQAKDVWLLIGVPRGAGERTELISAVVAWRQTATNRAMPDNMSAAVVMINLSLVYDRFRELDDASEATHGIGRA
jgi:hypothetical protein